MSKFWKIKNEAGSQDVELYLYGQIAEEPWRENDKSARNLPTISRRAEGRISRSVSIARVVTFSQHRLFTTC